MPLPNPEIWGAPETWIYSLRQYGLETTAAKLGNFDKPKTAYFGEGGISGYEGSLYRAINTSQKLVANEFLDESICPCGQDAQVSPWGKIAIFNKDNNGSVVPEIQDFTDKNVNWFFADKAESRPLFYRQIIWQTNNHIRNEQYAPNADTSIEADNIPLTLCPYVSWGLKSLLLSIEVGITLNDANPISGSLTWVTLDEWKNNYSTTHYMAGLRFFVRSCKAVNDTTLALTYNNDGTLPAGEGCSGLICILNKIKVKNPTADTPTQFLYFMGYEGSTRRAHIFTPTGQISVDSSVASAPTLGVLPCWKYFQSQTIQVYHPYSTDYFYYYKIPYSDDTYNKIMSIAALFGCYFTPTNKYEFSVDMLDTDLYLPVLDGDGVAHGQYTNGADNANNPLYSKRSIRDMNYDPYAKHYGTYCKVCGYGGEYKTICPRCHATGDNLLDIPAMTQGPMWKLDPDDPQYGSLYAIDVERDQTTGFTNPNLHRRVSDALEELPNGYLHLPGTHETIDYPDSEYCSVKNFDTDTILDVPTITKYNGSQKYIEMSEVFVEKGYTTIGTGCFTDTDVVYVEIPEGITTIE